MELKSIEIGGFKSFAEKTKIIFTNGMTGIVGPNGSGKSNIAEAIRWALGEQSAKSLRGSKMPDVIFSGSPDRNALNLASVTLSFNNSDKYVETPSSNLKISRKLFRNGDSEYLINDKSCRLKDITNLFMDSGIGQGSLSIISQGNVEAIFNSKPDERRSIIENVAGVYKYKQQKTTAEREIQDTKENLNRINDIIHELKVRLEPLEKQSSLATDYLDQKSQLDELLQKQLIIETKNLRLATTGLTAKVNENQSLVKQLTTRLSEAESQRIQQKNDLNANRNSTDKLTNAYLDLSKKIAALTNRRDLSNQQHDFKNSDIKRLKDDLKKLASKVDVDRELVSALTEQTTHQKQNRDQLQKQLSGLAKQQNGNNIDSIEQSIQALRDKYVDLLQEQTQVKNQINLQQRDNQQFDNQIDNQRERIRVGRGKTTQLQDQFQALIVNNDQQQANITQQKARLEHLETSVNNQKQVVKAAENSWLTALKIAERTKAQAKSLKNLHDSYRGFYFGVSNLLKYKDHIPGVYGPVSDYLQIPDTYVTAIDTALGSQSQQVIVEDNQVAAKAIHYLTKNRLGRVTLLPMNTIKSRYLSSTIVNSAQKIAGFVGVAATMVVMPKKMTAILSHLLGLTLIANNLQSAIAISRAVQQRCRIVTLDGQIVNSGGSLTGGANENNSQSVLLQQNELKSLENSVSEMNKKLTAKEQELTDLKNKEKELDLRHDEIHKAYLSQIQSQKNTQFELNQKRTELDTSKRQTDALTLSLNNTLNESNPTEITTLTTKCDRLTQDLASVNTQIEANTTELRKIRQSSGTLNSQKQRTHDKLLILEQEQRQLQNQQLETNKRLHTERQSEESLRTKLKLLLNDVKSQKLPDNLNEQISATNSQQEQLQVQIRKLKEQNDKHDKSIDDLEAVIKTCQTNLNNARYELNVNNDKSVKIAGQLNDNLNALKLNYDIKADQLAEIGNNWNVSQINRQVKMINMGLDEIGPVNINAIEEFKNVNARYEFLIKQRDDLLAANTHLADTMSDMDKKIATKFKKAFDEIAHQFSLVFVEMFGGGEAKLVLTDPQAMLTTGIEIMVQPPGKNYRRLSLLSGGEKALTAITLLFAVIKVHPVPFCILDEAEAALDPFNADRFARFLKKFDAKTQFIVITHRKETMIYADQLYGITMQNSGVSKVVSVSLDNLETEVN